MKTLRAVGVDNKKLKISDAQRLASLGVNEAAPLALEDVFAKTELAQTELKRRDSALPQRLKTVLMLIDGRTPYGSFARSLRAYQPVDELFMLLRDTGYIAKTGKTKFFAAITSHAAEVVASPRAHLGSQSASTGSSLLSKRQSVAEILGDPANWELPVIPQTPTAVAQAPLARQAAIAPSPRPAPAPAPALVPVAAHTPTPMAVLTTPSAAPLTTAALPAQALSPVTTARVAMPAPAMPKVPSAAVASLEPFEAFVTRAPSPPPPPPPPPRTATKTATVAAAQSFTPSLAAQSRALKLGADLLCDAVSAHAGFDGMEVMLALERCVLVADLKALLPRAKALLEPAMGQAPLHSLMQRIDAALAL